MDRMANSGIHSQQNPRNQTQQESELFLSNKHALQADIFGPKLQKLKPNDWNKQQIES